MFLFVKFFGFFPGDLFLDILAGVKAASQRQISNVNFSFSPDFFEEGRTPKRFGTVPNLFQIVWTIAEQAKVIMRAFGFVAVLTGSKISKTYAGVPEVSNENLQVKSINRPVMR